MTTDDQITNRSRMIAAREIVTANGREMNDLLVEYTNAPGTEMDDSGDVWDGRGYWWDETRKGQFLSWLDCQ